MNRGAALGVALAIPFFCAAFFGLTRLLDPLTGYALALCLYWFCVLTPLMLWHRDGPRMRTMARPRWPGAALAALSAAVVALAAAAAFFALAIGAPPPLLLALALGAALVNGTLEEAFWRGTLLPAPDPGPRAALAALGLFVGWHVAPAFASGIEVTGGPAGLLAGAAVLGALALALRLRTGGWGAPALLHVGFNLFAFVEMAARNA